jgi:sphingosine kinase
MKYTTLGIIPAGSGNGYAKNICIESNEDLSPENCAYIISKGQTRLFDLMEIESASRSDKIYSFLSFSWGIIASCDLESEKIRYIGTSRFTIWGVYCVLFQSNYFGNFSYSIEENIDKDFKYPKLRDELNPKYFKTESKNYSIFYTSIVEYISLYMKAFPLAKIDDGLSDTIVLIN